MTGEAGRELTTARGPLRWLTATALLWVLLAATGEAQTMPQAVGRVEGRDVEVKSPPGAARDSEPGRTWLYSGSELTVRSGSARVELEQGGTIEICGPAQVTFLKSGGSVTLALQYGRLRARPAGALAISIFTALVQGTLIAVGDGPRDAVIGLDAEGTLCVLAYRGAVRLEQQLTGQSLILPESSEVSLRGSQLERMSEAPGACRCESEFSQAERRPATTLAAVPLTDRASSTPARGQQPSPAPAREPATWKAILPPLTYNAGESAAGEPRPEMVLLVREARLRPAVIFKGKVAAKGARKEKAAADAALNGSEKNTRASFGSRLKNFFRRLFGGRPKTPPATSAEEPSASERPGGDG